MIDRKKFDFLKDKFGYYASWAIWSDEGEKPKSNIGDLSVLDPDLNEKLLSRLNPHVVFVGLNISRGSITIPLSNFHDKRPEGTDYKIRYAFRGSPYWGGYMTDIIKDYKQKSSTKVAQYLRSNKQFEKDQVDFFREEIKDLGSVRPTFIAFGNDVYEVLNRNFEGEHKILKVPHYANYINKENYRDQVKSIW